VYHGGTDSELVKSVMTPRQLLSPQARAALFDPPTEVRAIVWHYTFSIEDLALIGQRRRNANRFGFAVHLAYLRFPGWVLGPAIRSAGIEVGCLFPVEGCELVIRPFELDLPRYLDLIRKGVAGSQR
jgi:hypothetical protein